MLSGLAFAAATWAAGQVASSQDGSIGVEAPPGYSQAAASAGSSFRFQDASGDFLTVNDVNDADRRNLQESALDALKALETQAAVAARCGSAAIRQIDLGGGRSAQGFVETCGQGQALKEIGVVFGAAGGRMLLVSAFGRFDQAVALLASVKTTPLPTALPILARPPWADLFPLPPRTHGGRNVGLFLASLLIGVPGLVLLGRALPLTKRTAAPPRPQSWSPVDFERKTFNLPIVFDIFDAQGGHYVAISDRKPWLVMVWGYLALCVSALAALFHAGSPLVLEMLIAAIALVAVGGILQGMSPRAVRLLDDNKYVAAKATEDRYSLFDPRATVSTGDELNDLTLKRRRLDGRRQWELADWQNRVVLEIWEDFSLKSRLLKALGQDKGYVLSIQGRAIGSFRRNADKARVEMTPIEGLSHHAVMTTLLFIERTNPGWWHP
jgi:hypothetical protein